MTIKIRKVVPSGRRRCPQVGWAHAEAFGWPAKFGVLGPGGGHKVGVHFTAIRYVTLKSEVNFRIIAAVGGEQGLAREVPLRCWNCTVSCPQSWIHDLVQ